MAITFAPVFTPTLGFIFLGEHLTYMHAVGGLAIVGGVVVVVGARSRDLKRQQTEKELLTRVAETETAAANIEVAVLDGANPFENANVSAADELDGEAIMPQNTLEKNNRDQDVNPFE